MSVSERRESQAEVYPQLWGSTAVKPQLKPCAIILCKASQFFPLSSSEQPRASAHGTIWNILNWETDSFTLCNPPGSKQYLIVRIVVLGADSDFVGPEDYTIWGDSKKKNVKL